MSAEDIFQQVVENQMTICGRCFSQTETSAEMDSYGGDPICGEDCGTLSATLEEDPIGRIEMQERGNRLLSHIQREYDINEDSYNEALELLSGLQEPPRPLFIDAIRVGIEATSIEEIMIEYDLQSEETQRTRTFLRNLPKSGISEEERREFDEQVVSELATVTVTVSPGTSTYFVPNDHCIPEKYRPVMLSKPCEIMHLVIREHEDWFWRGSSKHAERWLDDLADDVKGFAAYCLFEHISSRHSSSSEDGITPEEQFRRTILWPILKQHGEDILGFLRRNETPQPLDEIAGYVGLSKYTVRTILTVFESAEPVSADSSEMWRAVERP